MAGSDPRRLQVEQEIAAGLGDTGGEQARQQVAGLARNGRRRSPVRRPAAESGRPAHALAAWRDRERRGRATRRPGGGAPLAGVPPLPQPAYPPPPLPPPPP